MRQRKPPPQPAQSSANASAARCSPRPVQVNHSRRSRPRPRAQARDCLAAAFARVRARPIVGGRRRAVQRPPAPHRLTHGLARRRPGGGARMAALAVLIRVTLAVASLRRGAAPPAHPPISRLHRPRLLATRVVEAGLDRRRRATQALGDLSDRQSLRVAAVPGEGNRTTALEHAGCMPSKLRGPCRRGMTRVRVDLGPPAVLLPGGQALTKTRLVVRRTSASGGPLPGCALCWPAALYTRRPLTRSSSKSGRSRPGVRKPSSARAQGQIAMLLPTQAPAGVS